MRIRWTHYIGLALFITLFTQCMPPADEKEEEGGGGISGTELPWQGELEKFIINPKIGIRLNDTRGEAGTAYLTLPSSSVRNTRWELGVRLAFNPSPSNYARFYLTSSSPVLTGDVSGYYIQIGGAKDNVALYRQKNGVSRLLLSGRELMKGNKEPNLYVRVECDRNGYWTVLTRLASEREYTPEGRLKDISLTSSVCFGICCIYTKSRSKGFTFHHLQLEEDIDNTPQEEPDKPDNGKPDTPLPHDPGLTELPSDVRGMLLFNEVMYDPAITGAEYVEIYNPTEQMITLSDLYLYKMHENGKVYSAVSLCPKEELRKRITIPAKGYLCFTAHPERLVERHQADEDVLVEIPKFPSLSNAGGYLALSCSKEPATGHTFDTCRFGDNLHDSKKKTKTGISLEKKSPELSSLNKNWRSSGHTTGGTPGRANQ